MVASHAQACRAASAGARAFIRDRIGRTAPHRGAAVRAARKTRSRPNHPSILMLLTRITRCRVESRQRVPRNLPPSRRRSSRKRAVSKVHAALLGVSVAAVSAYQWYAYSQIQATFSDYRAFWCAGSVLLHGGDPYRTAMLLACEPAPVNAALYVPPAHVALPVPLPLYGLLGFVPFALLPYAAASLL